MRTCLEIEAGSPVKFERTPSHSIQPNEFAHSADPQLTGDVARFVNPLASAALEGLGPDPKSLEMLPAPSISSVNAAAEMVELYWMALLRDLPLSEFSAARLAEPVIPSTGQLDIRPETIFRSGLHDEDYGPIISQFFLRDVGYGTQTISVQQVPYLRKKDFLTTHEDWLRAQNTGKDKFGRDYGACNHFGDQRNEARRAEGAD